MSHRRAPVRRDAQVEESRRSAGNPVADPRHERVWERGWEGHAVAQARRMAALTIAEKLDWLEQAHALVLQLRRGHEAPPPDA